MDTVRVDEIGLRILDIGVKKIKHSSYKFPFVMFIGTVHEVMINRIETVALCEEAVPHSRLTL